jgi:hypothetical protein
MNGADIGPLAACMLTDLTKIAKFSENVRAALHLSRTKLEEHIGGLPQLRNQVMHPVRPMVVKAQDVSRIHGHLKDADFLISLISHVASKQSAVSPALSCDGFRKRIAPDKS